MMRSSFAGAVFALLLSGPAQAQSAAHPAAAGHVCGNVSMSGDGRIVAPAGVDADAVDAGRTAIGLFPIDALMMPLANQIDTDVDKGLASTTDAKKRAVLLRIKKDKPEILAKLRAVVVDTIASGIACHQTRHDLEALAGFMKTSAAQKMATAYVVHKNGGTKPELTAQEQAQLAAFTASDPGKHVFSEFRDGSQTDIWMKAQFPIMGKLIQDWLESRYHLEGVR